MASKNTTISKELLLKLKVDSGNVIQEVDKVRTKLSSFNLPKNRKDSMDKALSDLILKMEKMREKLNESMSGKQLENWNSQWKSVSSQIEKTSSIISKEFKKEHLIFDKNTLTQITKIEKRIEALKTVVNTLNSTKRTELIKSRLSPENQVLGAAAAGFAEGKFTELYKELNNETLENLKNQTRLKQIIEQSLPDYRRINDLLIERAKLTKGEAYNAHRRRKEALALNAGTPISRTKRKNLQISEDVSDAEARNLIAIAEENYTKALIANQAELDKSAAKQVTARIYAKDLKSAIKELTTEYDSNGVELKQLDQELENIESSAFKDLEKEASRLGIEVEKLERPMKAFEESAEQGAQSMKKLEEQDNFFNSIQSRMKQIFGLVGIFQLLRRAIREVYSRIKELDEGFTKIAVVTAKTTAQLWESFDAYNEMAQKLGVTTINAIDTSALFYQQGLETKEVMILTTEAIKMARIAGMEFSAATKAMTAAIRGFKMEMSEAENVTDVYSALAARAAVSTQDLATAMTKTASIAKSAGMEFETVSAFLAQIMETTQEPAETAGTAMKTVIARFTEMKKNFSFTDAEGEIVDVNKIDKVLREVGVSLKDGITGQIRSLDQVFLELSSKWEGLTRNTQRYIATIAAGSRQQSRFIAMMDNYQRTMQLVGIAQDAAGAGSIQFNKTLDSVQAKINQIQSNFEGMIGNIVKNKSFKGLLDIANRLMSVFVEISKIGPMLIVPVFIYLFSTVKNVVMGLVTVVQQGFKTLSSDMATSVATGVKQSDTTITTWLAKLNSLLKKPFLVRIKAVTQGENGKDITPEEAIRQRTENRSKMTTGQKVRNAFDDPQITRALSLGIQTLTTSITAGLAIAGDTIAASGAVFGSTIGSTLGMFFGPLGSAIGGAVGALVGGITTVVNEQIKYGKENTLKKIKEAQDEARRLTQIYSETKADLTSLEKLATSYKELSEQTSLTEEETKELADTQNRLALLYPELSESIDVETGLLVLNNDALEKLIATRQKEVEATMAAAKAADYFANEKTRNKTITDFSRDFKSGRGILKESVGFLDLSTIDNTYFTDLIPILEQAVKDKDFTKVKEIQKQMQEIASTNLTFDKISESFIRTGGSYYKTEEGQKEVKKYLEERQNEVKEYFDLLDNTILNISDVLDIDSAEYNKIGSFSFTVKDFLQSISGKEISGPITTAISSIVNEAFTEASLAAIKEGEPIENSAAWIQDFLNNTLDDSFKNIVLNKETKSFNAYAALLPYFNSIDTAIEFFGENLNEDFKTALRLSAEDLINISSLKDPARNIILDIAETDIDKANEIAMALSTFDIDEATIIQLQELRGNLEDLGVTSANEYLEELIKRLGELGYNADDAANFLISLTSQFSDLEKLLEKGKEGTLEEYDKNRLTGLGINESAFIPTLKGYKLSLAEMNIDGAKLVVLDSMKTTVEEAQLHQDVLLGTKITTEAYGDISYEDLANITKELSDSEREILLGNLSPEDLALYNKANLYLEGYIALNQDLLVIKKALSEAEIIDASSEVGAIKRVSELTSDLQTIAGTLESFEDGFSAESLRSLIEAFSGKVEIDDFNSSLKALEEAASKEEAQAALEGLMTLVFYSSDAIKGLTEENQDLIASLLGRYGLINANDLVTESYRRQIRIQEINIKLLELQNRASLFFAVHFLDGLMATEKEISLLKTELEELLKPLDFETKVWGEGKKEKDPYRSSIEAYRNFINETGRLDAELERLKDERDFMPEGSENTDEYKKNLADEKDFLSQKVKNLEAYLLVVEKDQKDLANKIRGLGYGDAVYFDSSGKLKTNLKAIFKLTEDQQEELDDIVSEYDETNSLATDIKDNIRDTNLLIKEQGKELEDNNKERLDAKIQIEDKIIELLIKTDEEALESAKERNEAEKKLDKDYLDSLRESVRKRRALRDKDKSYDDLAKKEKRLALLKRDTSGIYAAEILNLEEELKQDRLDIADKETDDKLDALEESNKKAAEAGDAEIETLEENHKDKLDSMEWYNNKAEEIMSTGYENMLSWLKAKDEEFQTASALSQQKWLDDWAATFNTAEIMKQNINVNGKWSTSQIEAHASANTARTALENATRTDGGTGGYAQGAKDISSYNTEGALDWYDRFLKGKTTVSNQIKDLFWQIIEAKANFEGKLNLLPSTRYYKAGGLANYTGAAIVHGSPSKPEAWLSAEDTKNFTILKELLSQVINLNRVQAGAVSTVNKGGDCYITIEIESLANDYDTEQMMNKIKQIMIDSSAYRNVNLISRKR